LYIVCMMQTAIKNSRYLFFYVLLFSLQYAFAQVSNLSPDQILARSIFKKLIAINTVHSTGNTTVAADTIARWLIAAGYAEKDVQVLGPQLRNRNLVARFHGSGKEPALIFLAHLDVVEARREDWSYDPFTLTETGGYFYGRGSLDIKESVSILVANFIRLKKEGYIPDRDLILVLTAGEESGADYSGIEWLIKNQMPLLDAAYCINLDAGEPQMKKGKRIIRPIQVSEKGLMNLSLEVKNKGGHSSLPVKDNAIYRLAGGLVKMGAYEFPIEFSETTKSYFASMASFESGQLASDMKAVAQNNPDTAALLRLATAPYYNGLMRTTCVATMVEAGHAINALPQSAKAIVNCRVLPGTSQEEVQKIMTRVVGDTQIVVTVMTDLISNPASPLTPVFKQKVEQVTNKLWPGIPVIPVMGVGASDGKYLRDAGIPVYGVAGVFLDVDDNRMHGKDERIQVKDFYDGLDYVYELIRVFTSGNK
jgi:acetylornithine deacetylase/succinyl-diaminopimelate desuccinylase-like protein